MEIIEFQGKKRPATYLGDAVYAIYDGFGYWLHTGSHDFPEQKVYLEPSVLDALVQFSGESISEEVIARCQ